VAGFYNRHIVPRLIHRAMSADDVARLREANVPAARGVVLEVGIGSGLNLPFYSANVSKLYGVDTSIELIRMARARVDRAPFPIELLEQSAEQLPIADAVVDTVLVTWSLCSIGNPSAALLEMRRVLKPGGSLIFVEHGLAPDASVQTWQNRMTPAWRRLAGGCHLNRKIDQLVRDAGFAIDRLQAGYLPGGLRPLTFMYQGQAIVDRPSSIVDRPVSMVARPR
jgi:ubiquinone/menaquinone biosynthesis C-methylase UbiE